jgi:diguanylate cyclase (GGDEF)-like protein
MEGMRRYTILIVDDEKMNLLALHQILSDEYIILAVKNGYDALKVAAKDVPDIILLDIVMPDINGFDVLVKLKESNITRYIPVIIITGLNSDDDEIKGFALGAVDYITKPFNGEVVRARVKRQLQIVQQMRAMEKLNLVDPLTNIPNRRCFDDRMMMEWKRAIREKKSIALLMMDIDKFKLYNDTYGHPQGDALLKTVAKIFGAVVRRPADLPARLGGEEFGVLLPDTSLEDALILAEKIRSNVEELQVPTADGKIITKTTISIGVNAFVPTNSSEAKDFIAKADEYLYNAKTLGRNRVYSEYEGRKTL